MGLLPRKTAKDGANSKSVCQICVEIHVAAKAGEPDPELNTADSLLPCVKQAQVPKHVIDKAMKHWRNLTEGRYEAIWTKWFDVGRWYFDSTLTVQLPMSVLLLVKTVGTWSFRFCILPFDNKGASQAGDADAIFEFRLKQMLM